MFFHSEVFKLAECTLNAPEVVGQKGKGKAILQHEYDLEDYSESDSESDSALEDDLEDEVGYIRSKGLQKKIKEHHKVEIHYKRVY
jgi:hypothetical protein